MAVYYVRPSVRPVVRGPFCNLRICINFQFGVPTCRDAFINILVVLDYDSSAVTHTRSDVAIVTFVYIKVLL